MNARVHSVRYASALIHTITGEGNCLLESLCYCLYFPYHTLIQDNSHVTRIQAIGGFRRYLVDKLTEIDPKTSEARYMAVSDESELQSLQDVFLNDRSISTDMLPVISSILDVAIYFIDGDTDEIRAVTKGSKCIILYLTNGHFSPTSVPDRETGKRLTLFPTSKSFVNEVLSTNGL